MGFGEIAVLVRLFLGALATFLGILLWSRTRDAAWILVVLGVLVSYAEIIFSTLKRFGIVRMETLVLPLIGEIPPDELIQIFLTNLPVVLFAVAFIILLSRRRLH